MAYRLLRTDFWLHCGRFVLDARYAGGRAGQKRRKRELGRMPPVGALKLERICDEEWVTCR